MMNKVGTFIILSIICGLLSYHAGYTNHNYWQYILVTFQYFSLLCALYYSGIIKKKLKGCD